jgi:cytochrome P450 family 4
MNPAFLRALPVGTFNSVVPQLFSRIDQDNNSVPIRDLMKAFTLDALGLSAFGMTKLLFYPNMSPYLPL